MEYQTISRFRGQKAKLAILKLFGSRWSTRRAIMKKTCKIIRIFAKFKTFLILWGAYSKSWFGGQKGKYHTKIAKPICRLNNAKKTINLTKHRPFSSYSQNISSRIGAFKALAAKRQNKKAKERKLSESNKNFPFPLNYKKPRGWKIGELPATFNCIFVSILY